MICARRPVVGRRTTRPVRRDSVSRPLMMVGGALMTHWGCAAIVVIRVLGNVGLSVPLGAGHKRHERREGLDARGIREVLAPPAQR